MEESHKWSNIVSEKIVNEGVVEVDSWLVDVVSGTVGKHARPRERETEVLKTQALEQLNIFKILVVEVVSNITGVSVQNCSINSDEVVPDAETSAVFVVSTLDLVRCSCNSKHKVIRVSRDLARDKVFTFVGVFSSRMRGHVEVGAIFLRNQIKLLGKDGVADTFHGSSHNRGNSASESNDWTDLVQRQSAVFVSAGRVGNNSVSALNSRSLKDFVKSHDTDLSIKY